MLGPLEVARDGQPVPLGAGKQRALLAALLLRANSVVPVDRLIDELWGDQPPESAPNALQGYVSALRKALEPERAPKAASHVLVTRPPGYAIHVGPDELDLLRFADLLEAGRAALAAGSPGQASSHLTAALALWRGPALADVAYEPFAEREASRLEELRLAATEELVQADLQLGRHQRWAGELEAIVEEHPLRERLAGQLMLALYRAGRQADALRVYGRLRDALREGLGIDPSDELRELETAILQQRPELRWTGTDSPQTSEDVPLPPRLDRRSGVAFCGRTEERQRLAALCDEVESGAVRTVAIEGEPGIGKTRLAGELAIAARARGWSVLYGQCDEDLAIPYQPFVEAFSHYVEHTPDDVLSAQALADGGHLARIVPAAARRVGGRPATPSSDPETERYLLLEAAAALIGDASARRPLLLVVDDLHWADRNTLLLFRHLARSTVPAHLLMAGTYRGSDVAEGHPLRDLLSLLRRDALVQEIALGGLGQPDVQAISEVLAGRFVEGDAAALSTVLLEETGGNPLFVLEITRHLMESGVIAEDGGTWRVVGEVADVALPQSVRDVFSRRASRLGPGAQRVLTTAALIGHDFDIDVLASVLGDDEDTVLAVLEATCAARLTLEHRDLPGSFSFTHALVAQAFSDQVGPTRRTQIHRRVAESLEHLSGIDPGARLPQLASHWLTAVDADRERAVHYARLAGDQALAHLAPDYAAEWYRKALDLTPEGAEPAARCDLLISLGTALRDAGDGSSRRVLLHAAGLAEQVGDGARLAQAALANSRGGVSSAGEVDDERVAVLESALDLAGPADSRDRARLLALLAMELLFDADWERRIALADEGLAVARRVGDPATLVHVLNVYADAVWVPHTLEQRLAVTAEHERLADRLGDPVQRAFAALRRLRVAWEAADVESVDRHMSTFSALADVHPYLRWNAVCQWPHRLLLGGFFDEAESKVQEAFEVGQAAENPDAFQVMGVQLVMVRWDQGRLPELTPLLTQVTVDNPGIPGFRSLLELALCEADQLDEARDHFVDDAAARFAHVQYNPLWLATMVQFAEVCAAVSDPGAAAVLHALLAPWRDQMAFTGVSVFGCVAHSLGQLAHVMGRYDDADRDFADAVAIYERMGAVNFLARTRLSWGRLLYDRDAPGDRERAAELLRDAQATAARIGLAGVERRCREFVVRPARRGQPEARAAHVRR